MTTALYVDWTAIVKEMAEEFNGGVVRGLAESLVSKIMRAYNEPKRSGITLEEAKKLERVLSKALDQVGYQRADEWDEYRNEFMVVGQFLNAVHLGYREATKQITMAVNNANDFLKSRYQ